MGGACEGVEHMRGWNPWRGGAREGAEHVRGWSIRGNGACKGMEHGVEHVGVCVSEAPVKQDTVHH